MVRSIRRFSFVPPCLCGEGCLGDWGGAPRVSYRWEIAATLGLLPYDFFLPAGNPCRISLDTAPCLGYNVVAGISDRRILWRSESAARATVGDRRYTPTRRRANLVVARGWPRRPPPRLKAQNEGAKWVAKPSRFNLLQSALDKFMKTKGRNKKDVKNEGCSG